MAESSNAKQRLHEANERLLQTLKRSFGPRGKPHLIQANVQCADALTLTSSASRYLENTRLGNCAMANTLVHLFKSKVGATYCKGDLANYLTEFEVVPWPHGRRALDDTLGDLLEIREGKLAGIPLHVIERGLRLALAYILGYLDDPRCPVKVSVGWSDDQVLQAVVKAVICTKAVAFGVNVQDCENHLVPLVLQAFLNVYEFAAHYRHDKLPVHFVHLGSMTSVKESKLMKGAVLLDRKWASTLKPPLSNVTVALFNATIDPSFDENDCSQIKIEYSSSTEHRLTALRQFADTLANLGVTAVISQKILPSYLQTYLLTKGIFALDRLGSAHIRAVQLLSGAELLSDWRLVGNPSSAFGFLSSIGVEEFGRGKAFVYLQRQRDFNTGNVAAAASQKRGFPVSTVMLAAHDPLAYGELVTVFNVALKVLSQLLEESEVVVGAGCTETHLAEWLRHQASLLVPSIQNAPKQDERTLRQLRQCVRGFADCLDKVIMILLQQSDSEARILLDQLHLSNRPRQGWDCDLRSLSEPRSLFGWNLSTRTISAVLTYKTVDHDKTVVHADVLDSLRSKREALIHAVESTLALMRVDSMIEVK